MAVLLVSFYIVLHLFNLTIFKNNVSFIFKIIVTREEKLDDTVMDPCSR